MGKNRTDSHSSNWQCGWWQKGVLAVYCTLVTHLAFAQAVTVPGKIPGSFSVSPSGAATYSIPIQVLPGIAGLQPKLSLEYNSQGGNGVLGVGWNLSGMSSVSRCPKTKLTDGVAGSVNYDTSDQFCLDGQRLIFTSIDTDGTRYVTESDSFSKITSFGQAAGNGANGPASFRVQTKAGLVMEYGTTPDSRIEIHTAKGVGSVVRTWALSKVTDALGNAMTISYTKELGQFYPSEIKYGQNYVKFEYAPRPDTSIAYHAGAFVNTQKRLASIGVGSNLGTDPHTWTYNLAYPKLAFDPTARSALASVDQCSSSGLCISRTGFNRASFLAAAQKPSPILSPETAGYSAGWRMTTGDVNGDGVSDMIAYFIDAYSFNTGIRIRVFLGDGAGGFSGMPEYVSAAEGYGMGWDMYAADVDGDGKSDMVAYQSLNLGWGPASPAWHLRQEQGLAVSPPGVRVQTFLSNGAGGFAGASKIEKMGSDYTGVWRMKTMDFNGDGRADMVAYTVNSSTVRYQIFASGGASGFVPSSIAQLSLVGGGGKGWDITTADVNGDGKPDLVAYFIGAENGNTGVRIQSFLGDGAGGFTASTYNTPVLAGYSTGWSMTPLDVNGDGKTDMVAYYVSPTQGTGGIQMEAFISDGAGNFVKGANTSKPQSVASGPGWNVTAMDANGDGYPDIVAYFIGEDHQGKGYRVEVYLGDGAGGFKWHTLSDKSDTAYGAGWDMTAANVNGDGRSDMVAYFIGEKNSKQGIRIQSFITQPSDNTLINAIYTNHGDVVIDYKSLAAPQGSSPTYLKDNTPTYPSLDLQIPINVVSRSRTTNGIVNASGVRDWNSVLYQYGGLKAEHASTSHPGTGRGMLGFRWMKTLEESTGIETYTEFSQQWPYTGQVLKSETRLVKDGKTLKLKESTNQFDCRSTARAGVGLLADPNANCAWQTGKVYFPFVSSSEEKSWDLNGVEMPRIKSTTSYEGVKDAANKAWQLGDPTKLVTEIYQGSNLKHRKTTLNEYYPVNTSTWDTLGKLRKAQVTSESWEVGGTANNTGVVIPPPVEPPPPPLSPEVVAAIMQILNEDD